MTHRQVAQHQYAALRQGDLSLAPRRLLSLVMGPPASEQAPPAQAYEARVVLVLAPRVVLWEAQAVTGETGDALSDEALVYAIARGDRDALAQLYDRQASLLLGLGARILAGGASAREVEDVLHDVFVEVWKHAGDFDPERASVRTWLCLRMRSRCLDRARAAMRRRAAPLEEALLEPLPEGQSAGVDASRVRHEVAHLPELQRQVLVLGYFQGMSSQEIADTLHIPLGTVKSRVAAALTHLRTILAEKTEGLSEKAAEDVSKKAPEGFAS